MDLSNFTFMASPSPRKLCDLSNEILFQVTEELDTLAPDSLSKLRLVSKQFDALVIPILYRSATLGPLLFPFPERDELDPTCRDHILANIRSQTREVSIRTSLDWKEVLTFMMTMKHFKTLR